jgi:hypothetical protein
MPETYVPLRHPRLSADAAALEPEQLAVYAEEAAAVLDILGFAATGNDAEQLRLAVARQINRTLALEKRGDGVGDVQSESKGDESYSYAGTPNLVDEVALAIVARVKRGSVEELPPQPGTVAVPTTYVW